MTSRKEILQLFIGLIEAQQAGAISDTLWMHNSDQTIWEFLLDKGLPDMDPDTVFEITMGGHNGALKSLLLRELEKEKSKIQLSAPTCSRCKAVATETGAYGDKYCGPCFRKATTEGEPK